jgi:limonene-1,2-epoxide hydrolase
MIVRPDPTSDNPLWTYFCQNNKNVIHKWHHYFDIYHNHFQRFRNQPVKILEIGVFQGGSLQMWKNYFGAEAIVYGVDIDQECKKFE